MVKDKKSEGILEMYKTYVPKEKRINLTMYNNVKENATPGGLAPMVLSQKNYVKGNFRYVKKVNHMDYV